MSAAARFRTAGWCVLAAWLFGAVAPMAGAVHALGDDPACLDPTVAQHPVTQFEEVLPPATHGHCVICHFQRTLRGASAPATPLGIGSGTARVAPVPPVRDLHAAPIAALPSRAPPPALG